MIFLYLLIGAATGLLSGLLGVGGGVIIVPAFFWVFYTIHLPLTFAMHFAIAGSLAVMALTSLVAAFFHYHRGNVELSLIKKLLPGMVLGVLLGSNLAAMAKTSLLELLFGILLLVIAFRLFFVRQKIAQEGQVIHLPGWLTLSLIMVVVGLCAGLLGVGGGVLIIPVLTAFGISMHKAAGVSASLIVPVALIGALNFMLLGVRDHVHFMHSTGYLYWPAILLTVIGGAIFAPLGTALGARFHHEVLKKIYAVLLFLIGLHFLL